MNHKFSARLIVCVVVYFGISTSGICHEIAAVNKSQEMNSIKSGHNNRTFTQAQLYQNGVLSIEDIAAQKSDLAKEMPDGYYEVVGFKTGNEAKIHFGRLASKTDKVDNLKTLSKNTLLFSRWEAPKTQKYYPYSYSMFWDKSGDALHWHIYMNHTGNSKTGHPAFQAYFETAGKLSGSRLLNMALVKGTASCLFLQKNAYGKKYSFNDITSRLAKPKHMAAYSKSVQWLKENNAKGSGKLYDFIEINTAEDAATIAAQEAQDGTAVPIGFGSIRHLLVGNIHAQLTYVVRKVNKEYFEQSVKAGEMKSSCS